MHIQTERLIIRPFTYADWRALKVIVTDFSQSEYAIYDHPFPQDDTGLQAAAEYFAGSGAFYAVCLRESNNMIGYLCLHPEGERFDLGYCFHSDFHGKGYAFESCSAAIQYMKNHGAKGFTAGTALKNEPSCRLLERLGFRCIGTKTVAFHKDSDGNDISFEGGSFVRP